MPMTLWSLGNRIIRDANGIVRCEVCPCGTGDSCDAFFSWEVDDFDCYKVYFYDETVLHGGTVGRWFWQFGDGHTSEEQNPVHTYTEKGPFTVSLMVILESSEYCTTSHEIELCQGTEVVVCAPIIIPYAFRVDLEGYTTGNPPGSGNFYNDCDQLNQSWELTRFSLDSSDGTHGTEWTAWYRVDFPFIPIHIEHHGRCLPSFGGGYYSVINQLAIRLEVTHSFANQCLTDVRLLMGYDTTNGYESPCEYVYQGHNGIPLTHFYEWPADGNTQAYYYTLGEDEPDEWKTSLLDMVRAPVLGGSGDGYERAWSGPSKGTGATGPSHDCLGANPPGTVPATGYRAFVTTIS